MFVVLTAELALAESALPAWYPPKTNTITQSIKPPPITRPLRPRPARGKKDDIWYGRTVIKSCTRLDYATAQNIIDKKMANGEKRVYEAYWPKSCQPTG